VFFEAAADYNANVTRGSTVADQGGITGQRTIVNTFDSECKGTETITEDHRQFRCQWNSANLNWLAQFVNLVALDVLVEAEKNQIEFGDELSKEGKQAGRRCIKKVAADCAKLKCGNPFNKFNSCLRRQCKDRFDEATQIRDRLVGANMGLLSVLLILLSLFPVGCSQKGDMGGGGPYYPPTTRVPEELPKLKDYSDNTGRSLDAAAALVSDKKELAAGQKYHQQMAAVADKNGTDPKSFYAPPADEKAADTSVPQAKSSSRSGGSVSSPAGGGGPSGLATVSTQEKPVADLTPRLAEDPREAGAGYAGGGSAAAGGWRYSWR
jgi:hypothetical protein